MPDGFLSDVWINYMLAHYSVIIGWLTAIFKSVGVVGLVKLFAVLDPRAQNNGMVEWIQLAFGHKAVGDELPPVKEPINPNVPAPQIEGK